MVNPRLIELAKRLGNKDLPSEQSVIIPKVQPVSVSPNVENSFILSYDDYGRELISKSNELFKETRAEIPIDNNSTGELKNMCILKRLALTTTIYKNPNLKNMNIWPITPLQSEQLLKEEKLPKPSEYWEELGLILYDTNGTNPKEAQSLFKSIKQHRSELGLSNSDLESSLLVVNCGIEKDSSMPYGVSPVVLEGLTKAYAHPVLAKTGQNCNFEYGLDRGLPLPKELGTGNRTLYMPFKNKDIGLRVLIRYRDLDLYARYDDLVDSDADGRVNVARAKK